MCGRFTLTTPTEELAAQFEVPDPPFLSVRYNIAPSQKIAVVGLKPDGNRRGMALIRWGLVPHWSDSSEKGPKPIYVRAESVRFKFGEQLREKRCLIPADGFYEWVHEGGKKLPKRFTLQSGDPFAFAGLWDLWVGEKQKLLTCCMIPTSANDLVRPIHDRMPVMLSRESYGAWLDPETPEERLVALLQPYPAGEMKVKEANPIVNSPKNDGPECLEAA